MISLIRLLLRWLFRFRGYNEAVLKTPGPVLLIPNHTSWVDWLFVGVCLDPEKNEASAPLVSTGACAVRVIPTDEESVILRETLAVLQRR